MAEPGPGAYNGVVRNGVPRLRRRTAPPPVDAEFFAVPRGYLDTPAPGSEVPRAPLHMLGWCLFPGASVVRVEVSVDGAPAERARLALERPELHALTDHPDAPICAFEFKLDLTDLPPEATVIRVAAVAHSSDERSHAMDPFDYLVGTA